MIKSVPKDRLKPLLPLEALSDLSLPQAYPLCPLVVWKDTIVDGIKRWYSAKREVSIMEIPEDPWNARIAYNLSRTFSLVEVSLLWDNLSSSSKKKLLQRQGWRYSPALNNLFSILKKCPSLWDVVLKGKLSIGALRDLAKCEDRAEELILHWGKMKGTVGEKRELARLACLAWEKGVLPRDLPHSTHSLREFLFSKAYPEGSKWQRKFHAAMKELGFPGWLKVFPPETLERRGVYIHGHLRREHLPRWEEVGKKLQCLFDRLREL